MLQGTRYIFDFIILGFLCIVISVFVLIFFTYLPESQK